ncbi:MAG TPA: hypothetical protein VN802_07440 [Stellaceae bacterium]|nr:hypothetical protein [Stellaceae bacterium]
MVDDSPDKYAASAEEAKRIHEIVRSRAIGLGFETFEVHFGKDSTGEPAVWISFILDRRFPTDKESVRRLSKLGRTVKAALFETNISRIPYVRFRERQEAAS